MVIDDKFYPRYPDIKSDDIGRNTSNMFIDTMQISNLYLAGIGGDYDGDTVTIKGIYTIEANEELERVMNSKYNYITSGNGGIRKSSNEAIQSLYNLTLVLPDDSSKITKSSEIVFS